MNNKNKIKFKDISVVVQGAIFPDITYLTLLSIRKYLPNAKIILSTWQGSNLEKLEFDKLILSKDPGGFQHSYYNEIKVNNVNRQILSTLNGIKAVETKYVMKIRSDFLLTGNSFLKFFNLYDSVESEFALFKHKILACSYFSRSPNYVNLAYHPSDIAFFGHSVDLLNLFDINLMNKSDEFYIQQEFGWIRRYAPEQYIFLSCLKKNNKKVSLNNQLPMTKKQINFTERYFASNFIFLEWRLFNLKPPQKFYDYRKFDQFSCITYIEWKKLYYKYVTHKTCYFIGCDIERIKLNLILDYYSLLRFFAKLITIFIIGKKNKNLRKKIRKKITRN